GNDLSVEFRTPTARLTPQASRAVRSIVEKSRALPRETANCTRRIANPASESAEATESMASACRTGNQVLVGGGAPIASSCSREIAGAAVSQERRSRLIHSRAPFSERENPQREGPDRNLDGFAPPGPPRGRPVSSVQLVRRAPPGATARCPSEEHYSLGGRELTDAPAGSPGPRL